MFNITSAQKLNARKISVISFMILLPLSFSACDQLSGRLRATETGSRIEPIVEPVEESSGSDAAVRVRLGSHTYVSSLLNSIFGPTANATVKKYVTEQFGFFGGVCDHYQDISDSDHDCPLYPSSSLINRIFTHGPAIPAAAPTRMGLSVRLCDALVSVDSNVLFAIAQVRDVPAVTTVDAMKLEDAQFLFELFRPGKTAPSAVSTALMNIASEAQKLGYPPIEGWRFSLKALCSAPDWQVP